MKYVAVDGKEFNTVAECLHYEADVLNVKPQMWDCGGVLTEDVESAWLVHLDNLSETTWFRNKSTLCEGIDEESTGWFYWDDWDERYVWMPDELTNILNKFAAAAAAMDMAAPIVEANNPLKTYRVKLTKDYYYQVAALDEEDAENKGMAMYFNADRNDGVLHEVSATEITD